MRWAGGWYVWDRRKIDVEFWWGNLKERDYLNDLGTDGRILHWIFKI
jgi:hypothetical protein